VHGLSAPPDYCPHKKMMVSKKEERAEVVEKRLNGIFDVSVTPLRDEAGGLIGSVHVSHDITERKRNEKELKESREHFKTFARHLVTVREEERLRIAREIHDELGQVLTALKMSICLLRDAIPTKQKKTILLLKSTSQLIDRVVASGKRICNELRPAVLEELGLLPAIEWLVEEFEKQLGGKHEITLELKVKEIVDKELATAIFRIIQEALTNIVRHAKADKIEITLKEKDDTLFTEGLLTLIIKDNGIGITRKQIYSQRSLGLVGIKERVESLGGGAFVIQGSRGKGTTLSVNIPNKKGPRKTQRRPK